MRQSEIEHKTRVSLVTSVGKMGCKQAAHFGAKVLQSAGREFILVVEKKKKKNSSS